MFYWNQFDKVQRDITSKPPCFIFISSYIELWVIAEKTGPASKRKNEVNFHDFYKQINDIGIRSLDLS